ncbi:hypothetical protein D3C80_1647880 [compost metagenome]
MQQQPIQTFFRPLLVRKLHHNRHTVLGRQRQQPLPLKVTVSSGQPLGADRLSFSIIRHP